MIRSNPRGGFIFLCCFLACGGPVLTSMAVVEPAPASGSNALPSNPPTSAAVMRKAYLALVEESIVPAKPRVIAAAALEEIRALAPDRAEPLPPDFGRDAQRDSIWLSERVSPLTVTWSVIEAMTLAADTAHTGLSTPQRKQGMMAVGRGHPLCSPGFNLYPLADGSYAVFDVVKGASADQSGLRVGDVVLRANGGRVLAVQLFHLSTLPAGTEVKLDLLRDSRPQSLTLKLSQADVSSVESRLLSDRIGYIRIRWFSRAPDPAFNTGNQVRVALGTLLKQGARGLVLDLRSALGGSGEVNIASALSDGEVIYHLQNPLASPSRAIKRDGDRIWPGLPIAIMINQLTVSAPEALALSLRELVHAPIIGQSSGGGLTEFSMIPLADGYSMLIPTGAVRGPISGATPAAYTVVPDTKVENPSLAELVTGRDPQLEAAIKAIDRSAANGLKGKISAETIP